MIALRLAGPCGLCLREGLGPSARLLGLHLASYLEGRSDAASDRSCVYGDSPGPSRAEDPANSIHDIRKSDNASPALLP